MGTLTFDGHKFSYLVGLNDCVIDHAERAGFKEIEPLRWVTRSPHKAAQLRRFANPSAERKFKKYFITDMQPPECIVYPDHLTPKLNQIESAWHALSRTPSYIGDEAGLGKTATAIMAINSSPGKTLIICPPYLKYNWLDELRTWAHGSWGAMIINSENELYGNLLILPDSLLTNKKIQERLLAYSPFKWLIVDEAHRFKTSNSQRTDALLGDEKQNEFCLTNLAERTVLMSGTPIPNGRPIELYPVLSRLAPESILHRNLEAYWKTFCGGKSITHYERGQPVVQRDLNGASNLKQFKRELQTKFMIRHLKKDCLKELGTKTRRLIFLDTPKKIHKLESHLLKDRTLDQLMGGGLFKKTLSDIATYRKSVGIAKIKPALEYIIDVLESQPGKLVINAYHIDVVEALYRGLRKYQPRKIRGGMTGKDKHRAVKDFRINPHTRVIVGNTLSMGLGNTLTAASRGISVEPEWTPGVNEQMEDRIHRIGQDKNVLWDYLVLRESLDERMLRRALEKETDIQTVMN